MIQTKFVFEVHINLNVHYEVIAMDVNQFFDGIKPAEIFTNDELKIRLENWIHERAKLVLKSKGYNFGDFELIGVLKEPAVKIKVEGSLP